MQIESLKLFIFFNKGLIVLFNSMLVMGNYLICYNQEKQLYLIKVT